MADKETKVKVLRLIESQNAPLSLTEIRAAIGSGLAERTLRRWLAEWVNSGVLERSGSRRSTRYFSPSVKKKTGPGFLRAYAASEKRVLVKQLRDLWTHTSTALEGNTLTLGDTHFILEEGLTISGKPLKDHQEVIGHAKAIELLYQMLAEPLTEEHLFNLHKAVQAELVVDICKPNGSWKLETKGTYVVTRDDRQHFIEYAAPSDVAYLMAELIEFVNSTTGVTLETAAACYAKVHAGIAHIHPFWDGNGRVARLVANIPLLKAGLPPLIISAEERRLYIQLLAEYELAAGRLTKATGVWPQLELLAEFIVFCEQQYAATQALLKNFMGSA